MEVDLDRQVLMWVNEDGGVRVLPISSGNDKPFIDEGQTSIAYTPAADFLFMTRKLVGGTARSDRFITPISSAAA